MRHGLKGRKLQRTSSHRYALLRNLVSALLHHEVIKTTVPKAKEAARMAEKIITYGKRGTDPSYRQAQAFLFPAHHYGAPSKPQKIPAPLPPQALLEDPEAFEPTTNLLPKLFGPLAERYSGRPGGYTRIQKFGKRPGDNAPVAIVSLVDGPRDLRFEFTARAVARELTSVERTVEGVEQIKKFMAEDKAQDFLRPKTKLYFEKVMKYHPERAEEFFELVADWKNKLRAEAFAVGHRREANKPPYKFIPSSRTKPMDGRRVLAGERLPGMATTHTGLGLARGPLARRRPNADRTPLFANEVKTPTATLDVD